MRTGGFKSLEVDRPSVVARLLSTNRARKCEGAIVVEVRRRDLTTGEVCGAGKGARKRARR